MILVSQMAALFDMPQCWSQHLVFPEHIQNLGQKLLLDGEVPKADRCSTSLLLTHSSKAASLVRSRNELPARGVLLSQLGSLLYWKLFLQHGQTLHSNLDQAGG